MVIIVGFGMIVAVMIFLWLKNKQENRAIDRRNKLIDRQNELIESLKENTKENEN